jgi:ribosomal protein L37AE/L43A
MAVHQDEICRAEDCPINGVHAAHHGIVYRREEKAGRQPRPQAIADLPAGFTVEVPVPKPVMGEHWVECPRCKGQMFIRSGQSQLQCSGCQGKGVIHKGHYARIYKEVHTPEVCEHCKSHKIREVHVDNFRWFYCGSCDRDFGHHAMIRRRPDPKRLVQPSHTKARGSKRK